MADNGDQLSEAPVEMGNATEALQRFADEGTKLLMQRRTRRSQETPAIGMADMSEDGTINLHLHTDGEVIADALISYKRNDKQYSSIMEHLGGIKPGEIKVVAPFTEQTKTDQIKREDITGGGNTQGDKSVPQNGKDQNDQSGKTTDQSGTKTTDQSGTKTNDQTVGQSGGQATDANTATKTPPQHLAPTADFSTTVNDTYNALPQNVRDALTKDGVKVVPTNRVTDVMPELAGQKPRGWPPGSTWDDVDGAYDTTGKRVIVAQRQGTNPPSGNDVSGLTRHETGHAVDHLRNFSHSPDFQTAYDREAGALPKPDAQALDYFLQPGDSGKEEMFAELFATTNGGATTNYRGFLLKKDFPDTLKVVVDQQLKL